MKNHTSLLFLVLALVFLACSDKIEHQHILPINTVANANPNAELVKSKSAYFGDLHIHTSWSFDAFVSNVRTTPDDAYRYGKGEAIPHVSGKPIQLQRPLDFMAVSDHAEYMGAMMQMLDENHPIAQLAIAKEIRNKDKEIVKKATRNVRMSIAVNWPYDDLIQIDVLKSTWQKIVESADRHYIPGQFTTFPAFEWTSSLAVYSSLLEKSPYAQNLHRNVIFKGGKVSGIPFSSFDSQNPEDLWTWMELQRSKGVELLAIPHNGNISDGQMYTTQTFEGRAMDLAYTQTRMRNEPVNEVVQNKGQSMIHPALSPNDEFANFEVYPFTLGTGDPRKEGQTKGSYVREAFKNGLAIEQKVSGNPFQFGIIGSSDTHNSASQVEENNSFGKSGLKDPTPHFRMTDTIAGPRHRKSSVGGLAGVWATQNTRESIFEALQKKEVFATSGTRIQVRFFASWDFDTLSIGQDNWESIAYDKGVPMGSKLSKNSDNTASPTFLVWTIKDAEGANLDRIQIIKGWIDKNGDLQEKIFNVAWSDNRKKDHNGDLPTVGNTVDVTTATYNNNIGAVALHTLWKDPGFESNISAFYYVRVLEIPTPRWTTYEAKEVGVSLPKEVPPTIQERAWSSPIWIK